MQPINDNIVPGLKARLDHPHISELWAELYGRNRNLVVGRNDSDLIDSLEFGNGLLRNKDRFAMKERIIGDDDLAICRGFVEANGGRIQMQTGTAEGTSFAVSFPVTRQPVAAS